MTGISHIVIIPCQAHAVGAVMAGTVVESLNGFQPNL